jgi:hypothetical protein
MLGQRTGLLHATCQTSPGTCTCTRKMQLV